MMIIPIGNDLYQNDFSFGSMVTGDLLIIFSGLLYAIDVTLCKYLGDKFDVKRVVQILSFISAAATIAMIVVLQIPMEVELSQLPNILVMSIVGTGMSTLFFLMGLKLIGAVRTVLLYSTTSVFGILFSWMILSETVTAVDIFSAMLVLAGIFLLRNKLAGAEENSLEENSIETKMVSNTNTTCMLLTKQEIQPQITKLGFYSGIKEKFRKSVFPNCGIG
ncbi:MAG: DMT family transporter, partial [Nitrosarchaeum sp.]